MSNPSGATTPGLAPNSAANSYGSGGYGAAGNTANGTGNPSGVGASSGYGMSNPTGATYNPTVSGGYGASSSGGGGGGDSAAVGKPLQLRPSQPVQVSPGGSVVPTTPP
jgi:hypothetical protein